jgi:hypothetical protein
VAGEVPRQLYGLAVVAVPDYLVRIGQIQPLYVGCRVHFWHVGKRNYVPAAIGKYQREPAV